MTQRALKIVREKSGSGDLISYYSDQIGNGLFASAFSVATLKQEIDKPIALPRYRFCWLNEDETVKEVLPEEDIVLGGSYQENYQNGQRRSISLTLFNDFGKYTPSINSLWAGTKFSFDMGIELGSGQVIWFPKGIYVITGIGTSHKAGNRVVNIDLSDKFCIFEGASGTLETTTTIAPGALIEEVIQNILWTQKGDGTMFDSKPFIYNSAFKGKKVQATITQQAGSTYSELLMSLATMLSAEIFYDVEGHLNFVPINYTTNDVDKPILYHFYEEKGDFGNDDLSFDLNDVINRVIVIGANINSEICDATAVNDDPASPLCYQRIGYRTAPPINDDAITSTRLAQERADYELRKKLILKSTISNEVRFNPLLLVNNLVTVTDEYYNFDREQFLVQSISCSLDYSGTMSLSSSNVRNLPFVIGG